MKTKKGFTLIELLVVVLIIGILAAIAVPQYQKAVLKSQFVRAKQSVSDIRKAYELYYLQTGEYTNDFGKFDFANNLSSNGDYICNFYQDYEIRCNTNNDKLSYIIKYINRDINNISEICRSKTTDTSDIYNKICQEETGKTASQAECSSTTYCNYKY